MDLIKTNPNNCLISFFVASNGTFRTKILLVFCFFETARFLDLSDDLQKTKYEMLIEFETKNKEKMIQIWDKHVMPFTVDTNGNSLKLVHKIIFSCIRKSICLGRFLSFQTRFCGSSHITIRKIFALNLQQTLITFSHKNS